MIKITKRKIKYEIIERLHCDTCATEMESTGNAFMTFPVLYEYVCPKCGCKMNSRIPFPSIEVVYGNEKPYGGSDNNE